MQSKKSLVRAVAAVAAAATCAIALDAAVVLAADPGPATQPAKMAPSTQPALVGGSISNEYARPDRMPAPPAPTLMSSPNGASSVNAPATVTVGGGVDAGQRDAAPMSSNTSITPTPTTRPAMR